MENVIEVKSFDFALKIIHLYSEMKKANEYIVSRQLLKSGTSIGANVREASAAQSKQDFIAKMSIASREARETSYWLELLDKSQLYGYDYKPYMEAVNELVNILTAIVKTSRHSLMSQKPELNSK